MFHGCFLFHQFQKLCRRHACKIAGHIRLFQHRFIGFPLRTATDQHLRQLCRLINAEKVALSGDKIHNKKYYNVSGYTGGLRTRTAGEMLARYPVEMVERSVWGMLPKGRLGRQIYKKLFVYEGPEHKHEAQQPEVLELKY